MEIWKDNSNLITKSSSLISNFVGAVNDFVDTTKVKVASLLLAAWLVITPQMVEAKDTVLIQQIQSNLSRSNILIPQEIIEIMLDNLVFIETEGWTKTGFFVAPNRVITTKHWNENVIRNLIENVKVNKFDWSPIASTKVTALPFEGDKDIMIYDFKNSVNNWKYYPYVNNNYYEWQVFFVWFSNIRGKVELFVTYGYSDWCREYKAQSSISQKYHTTQLNWGEKCFNWPWVPGTSWWIAFDNKWNIIWSIKSGFNDWRFSFYEDLSTFLVAPDVKRTTLK
jgi:hypothetical protein